jgi:hypothetical protein
MRFGKLMYSTLQPTRKESANILRISKVIKKLYDEDEMNSEDWTDLLLISTTAIKWIVENSKVEVTQITDQVHFQPKKSLKKKKKRKG